MPLIGAVVVLIQFCFAYHALKTGRPYWWLFVIMAFPVMGCVIYYFVEVFPGSREARRANSAMAHLLVQLNWWAQTLREGRARVAYERVRG